MLRFGVKGSNIRQGQRSHRHCVVAFAAVRSSSKELLDSFWEARGVLDPVHRKRLVDAAGTLYAERIQPLDTAPLAADAPLPGLPATWQLAESTPEVLAASRRLLALQQLLGGDSPRDDDAPSAAASGGAVDVVWMVVREPGLLSADLAQLTGRLLDMKLATLGSGVDVLRVVEAQPALLLSDRWRLDLESLQAPAAPRPGLSLGDDATPGGQPSQRPGQRPQDSAPGRAAEAAAPAAGLGPGSAAAAAAPATPGGGDSAVQELVQAWQYGIASDGDREWADRLASLAAYAALHGDTGVGFRQGDDPELARWAAKQRADWRRGSLAPDRLSQLSCLGFEFDADEAEWVRWLADLAAFKDATGHASPMPLVTGADMYLINWCSVQRIARRSRVLSESRIQRLDELGFDWSGADPLS